MLLPALSHDLDQAAKETYLCHMTRGQFLVVSITLRTPQGLMSCWKAFTSPIDSGHLHAMFAPMLLFPTPTKSSECSRNMLLLASPLKQDGLLCKVVLFLDCGRCSFCPSSKLLKQLSIFIHTSLAKFFLSNNVTHNFPLLWESWCFKSIKYKYY